MLLAIDAGNSHIVIGCFDGETPRYVFRMVTDHRKTGDEYYAAVKTILDCSDMSADFNGAIVSSVVPNVTGALLETARRLTGREPLVVGPGLKTGLNIKLDNPVELAGDLASSAVGALTKYGAPVIVVDLGTATKLLVINRDGAFIGGAICPGVAVSAEALTNGASLLPRVSIEAPKKAVASGTVDGMKSGIVFGAAAMIDGMLQRFREELGYGSAVVATGGLARSIVPHCRSELILDENLILDGLRILYEKNRK